jgi:hypothetical protein
MKRMKTNEWIGVDLDGTLAYHDEWTHHLIIGDPIPKMVDRVKKWIADGMDVRVMTARVHPDWPEHAERIKAVENWCLKHIGTVLPVTYEKDYLMVELWDDRAIQVIKNTGERVDGKE